MKIKGAINKKISLFVAFCIVLVVTVSEMFSGGVIQSLMISDSKEILEIQAQDNAEVINKWLEKQVNIMQSMMESIIYMNDTDHEKIMDYLEPQLALNEDALMYYVCFAYDKSILPADHSVLDLDPTEREWWKLAIQKNDVIYTAPYTDFYTGKMIVSIAAPFRVRGQQAVFLADITINRLIEIVNAINTDENTQAFLLAEDGSVITHANQDFLPTEKGNTILNEQITVNLDTEDVDVFTDYDGVEKYLAVRSIEATGWQIGITRSLSGVQAKIMGTLYVNIGVIVLLMVVSIALLYWFVSGMLRPVQKMIEAIVHIADGDFSVKVETTKNKDEIGILQNAVATLVNTLSDIIGDANRLLGSIASYDLTVADMKTYPGDFNHLAVSVNVIKQILNQLLSEVQASANSLQNSATEFSSAAEALADGTSQQAFSIDKLETDVGDIAEHIRRNSEHCTLANDKLGKLNEQIQEGNQDMKALLSAVVEIEEMSEDIQKIVKTIDSIAFQTNLLALNASVEAARVGESGKGFAVVADEVRSLANKCGEESRKTAELIEGCIESIMKAKACADSTFSCLGNVVESAVDISHAFDTIASDTAEQAQGSEHIEHEIGNIADVVQSNTATSEETAASSKELSDQALRLAGIVGQFRITRS